MQPRNVLIADPSPEIRSALAEALEGTFQVLTCGTGPQVLELLRTRQTDLLILELELPELDGIAVLRRLAALPRQPKVMVTTNLNTDFIRCTLENLNVSYAMRKPVSARILAERAGELLMPAAAGPLSRAAADLLIRLAIPDGSRGFHNLLVALPSLALQPDQSLSKELYAEISRVNRVSQASVEKAIRDAIHCGWERGNRSLWLRYFPGFTHCPRNREFLFRMAEHLRRRRRCG